MPVREWGIPKDDEDIKKLEETIFLYAKQNLAVVNVYIKVFHHLYYVIAKCNIMKIDCLTRKTSIDNGNREMPYRDQLCKTKETRIYYE